MIPPLFPQVIQFTISSINGTTKSVSDTKEMHTHTNKKDVRFPQFL